MTEEQKPGAASAGNLFHNADLLLRWRKFIVRNTVAVTLIALVVSLLLPKWYRSVSTILPPKDQGFSSLLGLGTSALRSIPFAGRLGGMNQSMGAYNYLAILGSRTVSEAVIRKFDLINVYDVSDTSMDLAIEELKSYVTIDVNEEETTISIVVIDKDRARAASMANYYVEMLNTVSLDLATREARTNREFIGKRLGEARAELKAAEDALRAYQERKGVVLSPDFASGSVDAVAELYAMKARKEIELAILERTVSEESDVVGTLRIELSEVNKKLEAVPEVGLESFRLYREAAIQQKILEFLVPLHEQAKIEEQKDVPVILVLDRAVPAEKKYKPKRALLVASAAVVSLLVSLLIVFGASYIERMKLANATDYERMRTRFSDARAGRFFRKG